MTNEQPRVLIVTPSYNGAVFIDETIYSIISQATDATILYHVQDGGSTDATLEKLRHWSDLIERKAIPLLCPNLVFSYTSAADDGMYDAINRAFAALAPRPDDILTWINSDDRLAPGVVNTLIQVFEDVPACRFLSGRISLLNENGSILGVAPSSGYARACLAAGLHDGRKLEFVMQEGTFFSGDLWLGVDGVDKRFRYAGDWDLWRRIASKVPHFTLDSITGFHRRRRGQLSADMDSYYREVDRTIEGSRAEYDAALQAIPTLQASAPDQFMTRLIRFDSETQHWLDISFSPHVSMAPNLTTLAGRATARSVTLTEGIFPVEGPYPEYGLPSGIHWMSGHTARGVAHVHWSGPYVLHLLARAGLRDLTLRIRVNGHSVFEASIPDPMPMRNEVFRIPVTLKAGQNDVEINVLGAASNQRPLLIIETFVTEERSAVLAAPEWSVPPLPMIARPYRPGVTAVIVQAGGRPDLLMQTVASIRSDTSIAASLIVIDDAEAASSDVIRNLRDHVDIVLPVMAMTGPDMEAVLDGLAAQYVCSLKPGDMLASGALEAGLAALSQPDCDDVRGLVDLRDLGGRLRRRRLPRPDDPSVFRRRSPAHREKESDLNCRTLGRSLLVRSGSDPIDQEPQSASLTVTIHEDGTGGFGEGTPLQGLAMTFAMLGANVVYRFDPSALTDRASVRLVMESSIDRSATDVPARPFELSYDAVSAGGQHNGWPIDAHDYVDTATLTPRSRWRARKIMALAPATFVVAIGPGTSERQFDRLCDLLLSSKSGGETEFLWLGSAQAPHRVDVTIRPCDASSDDLLLSYALSASDVLVISADDRRLELKAACCELPVLHIAEGELKRGEGADDGSAAEATISTLLQLSREPGHGRASARAARLQVEANHALEAFALRLIDGAAAFPPQIATWLQSRTWLDYEATPLSVVLSSGRGALPPSMPAVVRLIPGVGARHAPADLAPRLDLSSGVVIDSPSAVVFGDLSVFSGERLRFRMLADRPVSGQVRLDGGAWVGFAIAPALVPIDVDIHGIVEPGLHRLDVLMPAMAGDAGEPCRLVLSNADLLSSSQHSGPTSTIKVGSRLGGRLSNQLDRDGDWHFGAGFYPEEPAYPTIGIFTPIRWSRGRVCTVHVRIQPGGTRRLRVAVTGLLAGQRIRPIIAGVPYLFCEPLDGLMGRTHHITWIAALSEGDVAIGRLRNGSTGSRNRHPRPGCRIAYRRRRHSAFVRLKFR